MRNPHGILGPHVPDRKGYHLRLGSIRQASKGKERVDPPYELRGDAELTQPPTAHFVHQTTILEPSEALKF